VVIEFFRTRASDDAHAVVGRADTDASDLDDAIGIGQLLSQTLDMPQRPDSIAIKDVSGALLFSGPLDAHHQKDHNHEHPH
jgi:hypothetical protein